VRNKIKTVFFKRCKYRTGDWVGLWSPLSKKENDTHMFPVLVTTITNNYVNSGFRQVKYPFFFKTETIQVSNRYTNMSDLNQICFITLSQEGWFTVVRVIVER